MKGYIIRWPDNLQFCQKWQNHVIVSWNTEVELPLSVSRKIHFALSSASLADRYIWKDIRLGDLIPSSRIPKRIQKFVDFILGTNCHWTAHEIMLWTWSMGKWWWKREARHASEKWPRIESLNQHVQVQGLPLHLFDIKRRHSVVIIAQLKWETGLEDAWIVFEKLGFSFPFQLSQKTGKQLSNFTHYVPRTKM